ncbi:EboA domain-containing protein [Streptomyces parvulus]
MPAEAAAWLERACAAVRDDPGEVEALFAVAARRCGRASLDAVPGWSTDDAVRTLLLAALPLTGAGLAAAVSRLYRVGGGPERRAVLRSLELLEATGDLGGRGLPLVEDALRSNDPRLITAAVGPYGARRLGAHAFRQAVLKCVFTGIPLARVAGLAQRADTELDRMMADFAAERSAAGRTVPPDVAEYLHTHRVSTEATA